MFYKTYYGRKINSNVDINEKFTLAPLAASKTFNEGTIK